MSNDPTPSPFQMSPAVVMWFKIYAGFLCALYLLVAAGSLVFFLANPADLDLPAVGARLIGALFLVLGLGLFSACLLPLLLTPRPWLWTYGLVIICLGMTSACFLPICIPLLLFWLKPDAKDYYGKT